MQSARDFLVKANLAKPGRGKFSNEAKEHLKQAIADGQSFTDWDENGRISVSPNEKNRIEKRADVIESAPVIPKRRPDYVRYREESQVVFTHPTKDQKVVLDVLKSKPIWAVEKIEPPKWLEGYTWSLQ